MNNDNQVKKLLVLDTSYTLEDIKKRGIEKSVTCRDLDGYFFHVWTVHPFASITTSDQWGTKYDKPQWHQLNSSNTFIEGKIGRYSFLKWAFPINFLISQIGLLIILSKLIKRENISVIRSGDMLYLGLFSWALSRIGEIPFLVRVGGNNDKVFETTGQPIMKRLFFTRSIEKKVEQFVFKKADLVAGANQDNLNFALANGATKEKSTIFRYGNLLDDNHFIEPSDREEGESLLKAIKIMPQQFLLYIGRLEKVKHPDHVLYALAYLRKKHPNIKVLFVGDGSMLDELKSLSNQMKIENNVVFAGNQNQSWLARVIPLSSVVMSPHTGRALSEAALGEVSVVAYDIDWQSEIIENEVTGLLVPHPNQQLFNEATERLLNDREFAKKMAIALKEKAKKMLDPKLLNENECKAYDKLIFV